MGMAVLGVAVAVVGVVNRNPNETLKSLKKIVIFTPRSPTSNLVEAYRRFCVKRKVIKQS